MNDEITWQRCGALRIARQEIVINDVVAWLVDDPRSIAIGAVRMGEAKLSAARIDLYDATLPLNLIEAATKSEPRLGAIQPNE